MAENRCTYTTSSGVRGDTVITAFAGIDSGSTKALEGCLGFTRRHGSLLVEGEADVLGVSLPHTSFGRGVGDRPVSASSRPGSPGPRRGISLGAACEPSRPTAAAGAQQDRRPGPGRPPAAARVPGPGPVRRGGVSVRSSAVRREPGRWPGRATPVRAGRRPTRPLRRRWGGAPVLIQPPPNGTSHFGSRP